MSNWSLPQPGEGWRHYKNLKLYEIVDLAVYTESGEPLVIYKLWGRSDLPRAPLYARPIEKFLASVEHEGRHVSRFDLERAPATRSWHATAFDIYGYYTGCSKNHDAIAKALKEIDDILRDLGDVQITVTRVDQTSTEETEGTP